MRTEVERISHLIKNAYNGSAWHGSSVITLLDGISATQAANHPLEKCHSIWEIIRHMIVWRQFAWNKLVGEKTFDVINSQQDWPYIESFANTAWQETLTDLEDSQQSLLQALNQIDDSLLEQRVPGRNYSYYILLHGIIQHDLYHLGQIALLKQQ